MDAAGASASRGTPVAEVAIDEASVGALIAEQHPDLGGLPLSAVDAGWDNAMFRLGDALAVRLPRRAAAAELALHEQIWLPRLAPQLTLPVPSPCRVGIPSQAYPWRWSVVPWLAGMTADSCEPNEDQATPFGRFLRSLHTPAPPDAPINPFRGVSLRQREQVVESRLRQLARTTDAITPRLRAIWETALKAPLDIPPTWLHGDLHPRNVLVENGVLAGVIDWGDLTAGDPATDLAAIWMLFDSPDVRDAALTAYGPLSEATLRRSEGWAILFGALLLESGLVDHPQHAEIGAKTLRRVEEGP